MDGNGRWAKKRLLNRIKGHEKGADTVRMVVETCRKLSVPVLTLYAFSTENWRRSEKEVAALMALLKKYLEAERDELIRNGIRLNVIGQLHRLPQDVREKVTDCMQMSAANDGMLLNLALSYGSRAEIVDMVMAIGRKICEGKLDPHQISEQTVSEHLYTRGMPDPDMLIRTSGEMRVSNFLLWQIAYCEIFVTDTLWPDFSREEFLGLIEAYQHRQRRFGGAGD